MPFFVTRRENVKIIIIILIIAVIYNKIYSKYKNPYKLVMVFGKKGSGKSTYLVKKAIQYQKKGYKVYTNMEDICLKDVRIIDIEKIGKFVPEENSLLILDEVGMQYDNRNFRNFTTEQRDFYKLQRHYKVVVYMASQNYDIDKKLRDLTDSMILVQNIGIVWSLIRPISKRVTLTESTSEGESRIAENLKFQFITNWQLTYIPKYVKYFESFKVPEKEKIDYYIPKNEIEPKRTHKVKKNKKSKTV